MGPKREEQSKGGKGLGSCSEMPLECSLPTPDRCPPQTGAHPRQVPTLTWVPKLWLSERVAGAR